MIVINEQQQEPPFNGLFSRTTCVSGQQKGRTILDFNKARQLDHMETICTLLQIDNHARTSSLKFFTGRMLLMTPDQQSQRIEGTKVQVKSSFDQCAK